MTAHRQYKPRAKGFSECFWEKIDEDGPIPSHDPNLGKCWVWTGKRLKSGYGVMHHWYRNKASFTTAHRIAWILVNGDPGVFNVLHKCDYKPCCNPSHLYLGTQLENVHDAINRGSLFPGAVQRRITHCPQGHEYTPDNLVKRKDGMRSCRICHREQSRLRMRKKYVEKKGKTS